MRMWSNRNSYILLMEMQNCTDTLEDSLANPYKTKYILMFDATNTLLNIYPNEIKAYALSKPVHKSL